MSNLSEAFARAEASYDNTLRAIQLSNEWDRSNEAARAHWLKGRALRLLDRMSGAVTRMKSKIIRF
jgi:hypothetical protein